MFIFLIGIFTVVQIKQLISDDSNENPQKKQTN